MAEHQLLGDPQRGRLHPLLEVGERGALAGVREHEQHVRVADTLLGPAAPIRDQYSGLDQSEESILTW